ncbi:MAG: 50S ribosomal protein L9 [Myxococcota bacterium]
MALVRIILSEDVPNLGEAGDIVNVKPGYARNFLLPRGMAAVATDSRVKEVEHHKRVIAEKLAKQLKDLEAVRDRIQALTLETTAQAGEEGKLFGSITSQNIAELLAEKGIEVDRRKIDLPQPIKSVGEHEVPIKLRREFIATVKVAVSAAAAPAPPPRVEAEPDEEAGIGEAED